MQFLIRSDYKIGQWVWPSETLQNCVGQNFPRLILQKFVTNFTKNKKALFILTGVKFCVWFSESYILCKYLLCRIHQMPPWTPRVVTLQKNRKCHKLCQENQWPLPIRLAQCGRFFDFRSITIDIESKSFSIGSPNFALKIVSSKHGLKWSKVNFLTARVPRRSLKFENCCSSCYSLIFDILTDFC